MAHTVNEIMTKNVVSVSSQQTIREAAQLMKEHNIGAIPVIDKGRLKGIVTDRDITVRSTANSMDANTPVSECMSTDVTVVEANMAVQEAASLMAAHQVRRLPVVENNRVVGMIALGDLAEQEVFQNEAGEALSSISTPAQPEQLS